MSLDARTPVLVGAATASQRADDPTDALEPVELMIAALEAAADDAGGQAGGRALLDRADSIRVPRGFWEYSDAGRLIADRFGLATARTTLAEIGVLQTTLLGTAADDIRRGRSEVVLITGGEARHRAMQAFHTGREAPVTAQEGVAPTETLRPADEIIHPLENEHGLGLPVNQYSALENALRFADGQSIDEHRDEVAELCARFAAVAKDNPDAWNRDGLGAAAIRDAVDGNRMLAFPYTKLHTSQWNVDQAAGLILTSVATAEALGISRDRWVFPLAVADSNFMISLSERRRLDRSPGFYHGAKKVFETSGAKPEDVRHREIYSCFPAAVRLQMREIGIGKDEPVSVTGGMTFGGGPVNNFVLQSVAKMAEVLRNDAGTAGMVTAVSGYVTKQGVSLWSTEPGAKPFVFSDVSRQAEANTERAVVTEDARGKATVATYTVIYNREGPERIVFICEYPDGRRTIVSTSETALAELATEEELCGRPIVLGPEGRIDIY